MICGQHWPRCLSTHHFISKGSAGFMCTLKKQRRRVQELGDFQSSIRLPLTDPSPALLAMALDILGGAPVKLAASAHTSTIGRAAKDPHNQPVPGDVLLVSDLPARIVIIEFRLRTFLRTTLLVHMVAWLSEEICFPSTLGIRLRMDPALPLRTRLSRAGFTFDGCVFSSDLTHRFR